MVSIHRQVVMEVPLYGRRTTLPGRAPADRTRSRTQLRPVGPTSLHWRWSAVSFVPMVETSLCGRVGCGEPATCVLLMAPQDTQAWLVSPQHDAAPDGVALCEMHADRISVPFGWALTDERTRAKPARKRSKRSTAAPKRVASKRAEAPTKAKSRTQSRAKPSPEPEPTAVVDEIDETETTSDEPVTEANEAVVEVGIVDEPTIQLPAVQIDHNHPSSPSEIPMNADGPAAAVAEESPRLSVVPGDDDPDKTFDFDNEGQGALWADRSEPEQEPDESTPLLKRAFRVVRDE